MAFNRFIILAVLGASLIADATAADTQFATATLNGVNSVPLIDTPTTASFV
jgi:hypothetical protein